MARNTANATYARTPKTYAKAAATRKARKAANPSFGLSLQQSQYYAQSDLPLPFQSIADEARVIAGGKVKWGWRQWILLAPYIHKHMQKQGRHGIATAMEKWQKILKFPANILRGATTMSVAFSPSSTIDLAKLAAFIVALPPRIPVAPYTGRETIASEAQEAPATLPAPTPAPIAPQAASESATPVLEALAAPTTAPAPVPGMQALMSVPLGVFAAPLRSLLAEVLRDVLRPNAEFIREVVKEAAREAVVEAIGEPTRPPAAPGELTVEQAQGLTPQEQAALIIQSIEAMPKPSEVLALLRNNAAKVEAREDAEDTMASGIAQAENATPAPAPVVNNHHARHGQRVEGATLEDKLANAAGALGIENHKRESVVCVGLNQHVRQEVVKYYGKGYRFTFLERDEFTKTNDLPASTDALLLCRKKLPTDLGALVRRYSIPTESIANTSQAVLWALSRVFPEHHAKGLPHAHH